MKRWFLIVFLVIKPETGQNFIDILFSRGIQLEAIFTNKM